MKCFSIFTIFTTLLLGMYSDNLMGQNIAIPNNEIWYTSTEGSVFTPKSDVFGANIVSNTYKNGRGVITFDRPISSIGDKAFMPTQTLFSYLFTGHRSNELTSITIPDSVTSIGDEAFLDCYSLKSFYGKFASSDNRCLIVEGALCAFAPSGLTHYEIPDGVTSIEGSAFNFCTELRSITISNSVTSIKSGAFHGCSRLRAFYGKYASPDNRCLIVKEVLQSFAPAGLTEYTIPDGIDSIGALVFFKCYDLRSIIIPDGVTLIFQGAFACCQNLTSITIPNSVISIGDEAFLDCSSLTGITIPESVIDIGDHAFCFCTNLTSVTIPKNVLLIGDKAFSDCDSLTSVYCEPTTPPRGGNSMFNDNASDRKIYVPANRVLAYKTASHWSDYADSICSMNSEEQASNNKIWYTSIDGSVVTPGKSDVFGANIVSNTYKNGWGVITFDGPVTSIGHWAFSGCNNLTSVIIPDGITWIGLGAFSGCSSLKAFYGKCASKDNRYLAVGGVLCAFAPFGLTQYTIPDSITSIWDYAFLRCDSLISVRIPNSVTSIGHSAFFNCRSLTSVTIPDSVISIGELAFQFCESLTIVYCKPTTPPSIKFVFDDNVSGRKIYVPLISVEAYKSAEGWSDYAALISPYIFD